MAPGTQWLLGVTTVACGLVAGVWFAFSSFVTQGLDRAYARAAVTAMQGINKTAVGPVFMLAFLGTALLCVAVVVWGGLNWSEARAKLAIAGSLLYLGGTFVVTMAANVPLNDRLERVDPRGGDVARAWQDYVGPWLAWNHVRTVTAIAAFALLLVAVVRD